MSRKAISFIICCSFILGQAGFAQVPPADLSSLAAPAPVNITNRFQPAHLRAFEYEASSDSLRLMLEKGTSPREGSFDHEKLQNYFLTGISLPDSAFWVNLRPDSPDLMIDPALAKTGAGRVMLEADLRLKKDTVSYLVPNSQTGGEYWDKLYKKAEELYGSIPASIPTLARPWIVPDEIVIRETKDSVYIYKARLKVSLESDHLKGSADYSFKDPRQEELNEYSSALIRDLIIPRLTKDVNTGEDYAELRQVYYSLILSQWFKRRFRGKSIYAARIDSGDLSGLVPPEPLPLKEYFETYRKSFNGGEFDISETVRTARGRFNRRYLSGGVTLIAPGEAISVIKGGEGKRFNGGLVPIGERFTGANLSGKSLDRSSGGKGVGNGGIFEEYDADIRAAEERGGIIYGPAAEDRFSPVDFGISLVNSRPLVPAFKELLSAVFLKDGSARVLVVGPGNGRECWDIKEAAGEAGADARVDTVGLSPLPTRLRLKKTPGQIKTELRNYLGDHEADLPGLDKYLAPRPVSVGVLEALERASGPIPLELALHLQDEFPQADIFSKLEEPYLNRQYICNLLDLPVINPPGQSRYDAIYDNRGGFFYTFREEGVKPAMGSMLPFIAENGFFYCHFFDDVPIRDEDLPPGFIVITGNRHLLAVREDSDLAGKISAVLGSAGAGLYRVSDLQFQTVLSALSSTAKDGGRPEMEDLKGMLERWYQRPDPRRLGEMIDAGLSEEDILRACRESGMDLRNVSLDRTKRELRNLRPYFYELVGCLLREYGDRKLLIAGRDTELLYDAYVTIAGVLKVPSAEALLFPGSFDFWRGFDYRYPVEERKAFFAQYGITADSLGSGARWLIVDTGFVGSIGRFTHRSLARLFGCGQDELKNEIIPIKLIYAVERDAYGSLLTPLTSATVDFLVEQRDRLVLRERSPLPNIFSLSLPAWREVWLELDQYSANYPVAVALQTLPKFHGPYAVLREEKSILRAAPVMPEERDYGIERRDERDLNQSVVNPAVALLMQFWLIDGIKKDLAAGTLQPVVGKKFFADGDGGKDNEHPVDEAALKQEEDIPEELRELGRFYQEASRDGGEFNVSVFGKAYALPRNILEHVGLRTTADYEGMPPAEREAALERDIDSLWGLYSLIWPDLKDNESFRESKKGEFRELLAGRTAGQLWVYAPEAGRIKGFLTSMEKNSSLNGRYVSVDNIAVADQGNGVGKTLFLSMMASMESRGIRRFEMNAVSEGSRILAGNLGWRQERDEEGEIVPGQYYFTPDMPGGPGRDILSGYAALPARVSDWRDGGEERVTFTREALERYREEELSEPLLEGLIKTLSSLYHMTVRQGPRQTLDIDALMPSSQSYLVLEELAARVMELIEGGGKPVAAFRDSDRNGDMRTFVLDGHHRLAAAYLLSRFPDGPPARRIAVDTLIPSRYGLTSFSRQALVPLRDKSVIMPNDKGIVSTADSRRVRFGDIRLVKADAQGVVFAVSGGEFPAAEVTAGNRDGGRAGHGGIDFRQLPVKIAGVDVKALFGKAPSGREMDIDAEWQRMQKMVNHDILPSCRRVKEYMAACYRKGLLSSRSTELLSFIARVLKLEEARDCPTDPAMKDMLSVLEAA